MIWKLLSRDWTVQKDDFLIDLSRVAVISAVVAVVVNVNNYDIFK